MLEQRLMPEDKRDREAELAGIAETNSLRYALEDPYQINALPLRSLGSAMQEEGSCWNLVFGSWERLDFIAFDFHYWTPSVDEPAFQKASCILTTIPAECPGLMVRPETRVNWLMHSWRWKAFASEPKEFARRFRVISADPFLAETLLDERMRDWFPLHGGRCGSRSLSPGSCTSGLCSHHRSCW
jgi:hypothetical protein